MNELVVPSEEHGRSFYAPAPKKPEAEKSEEVAEPRVSTRKCGMGSGWLCMSGEDVVVQEGCSGS